jgi:circadian clock protein KaiC
VLCGDLFQNGFGVRVERIRGESVSVLAATGIAGFDGALNGGLPRSRTTLVVGSPGSGKTTLALQFLAHGALNGEPGLMLSFEESPEALSASAASLAGVEDAAFGGNLYFFDGRPEVDLVENGTFDIGGVLAIARAQIQRSGIRRIVLDGLDALFLMAGQTTATFREFQRLLSFVREEELTAIVTFKPNGAKSEGGYDLFEYAAHAVVSLRQRIVGSLLRRTLQIVKIRHASYAAGEHPYLIGRHGFEVAYVPAQKPATRLSRERLSTGVRGLDEMLEGGLLRSTVTLVTGLPGTAKSTIGGAFLAASLQRGERALLVAMDEPAPQLIANVRGVGIDLEPYIQAGSLRTLSLNAGAVIADEHYLTIVRELIEHDATVLVLDPVSALEKGGGQDVAVLVVERLAGFVKQRGLAALFTAVASAHMGELEATVSQASSIADSWIHLSYAAKGGERNRTLTIVKSRGTAHSNMMREMILSDEGIRLEEVYGLEGELLLGTSRVQRKQQDRREAQLQQMRVASVLRDLEERKRIAEAKRRDAETEMRDIDSRIVETGRDAMLFATEDLEVRADILSLREGRRSPA